MCWSKYIEDLVFLVHIKRLDHKWTQCFSFIYHIDFLVRCSGEDWLVITQLSCCLSFKCFIRDINRFFRRFSNFSIWVAPKREFWIIRNHHILRIWTLSDLAMVWIYDLSLISWRLDWVCEIQRFRPLRLFFRNSF